jgi:hypothetical protein
MAITIAASLAKRIPIKDIAYSSRQASITITSEISDLNQVTTEAQRLYALAEQAVDAQLLHHPATPVPPLAAPGSPQRGTPAQPAAGVRPPPPAPRRGVAPVTDSQLRYLERLMAETRTSAAALCQVQQVGSLRDLSCQAAAGIIDELKAGAAA